jgi:hypothetical protein
MQFSTLLIFLFSICLVKLVHGDEQAMDGQEGNLELANQDSTQAFEKANEVADDQKVENGLDAASGEDGMANPAPNDPNMRDRNRDNHRNDRDHDRDNRRNDRDHDRDNRRNDRDRDRDDNRNRRDRDRDDNRNRRDRDRDSNRNRRDSD